MKNSTDTIVALSSSLSKSAISIVRLSGKDSLKIASNLFKNKKPLVPRMATLKKIYSVNLELLDEAICIYFKAPFSFNGEDILEIQTHGGLIVARLILDELLKLGARMALNGEFSKRAFLNNKLELSALLATSRLINARSKNEALLAIRHASGHLARYIDSIKQEILDILASIEALIDYSLEVDLELEGIILRILKLIERFEEILKASKFTLNTFKAPKMCILGKPNAGKSSFLNAILLKDRAIISDEEGTTRDTISELIDINGNLLEIIDTAGIRQSPSFVESKGIEKSFEVASKSDILLCIFDGSKKLDSNDFKVIQALKEHSLESLALINKSDLKQALDIQMLKDLFKEANKNTKIMPFSTKSKSDMQKVSTFLEELFFNTNLKADITLSESYQVNHLNDALSCLNIANTHLKQGVIELASYELINALEQVGFISGGYDVEQMLDSMFSQFCVGK